MSKNTGRRQGKMSLATDSPASRSKDSGGGEVVYGDGRSIIFFERFISLEDLQEYFRENMDDYRGRGDDQTIKNIKSLLEIDTDKLISEQSPQGERKRGSVQLIIRGGGIYISAMDFRKGIHTKQFPELANLLYEEMFVEMPDKKLHKEPSQELNK